MCYIHKSTFDVGKKNKSVLSTPISLISLHIPIGRHLLLDSLYLCNILIVTANRTDTHFIIHFA